MPKRTDIHKILVIGSGPIVIGQACEFDYSGTQACKALRSEGLEVILANSNPATLSERFWEAHDLILKALSSHDGPFNWEGRHFHYRQVNVWPRPYQSPHPPVWMTTRSCA